MPQQIKFITGITRGSKVLVLDNHIFYANRKTNQSTYFKCAYSKKKGCTASVVVRNINPEDYTFESFTVLNAVHLNHLPSTEKILRREGKAVENFDGMQTDLVEALENCTHICLFCLSKLPQGYQDVTSLETVVPYGDILTIPLDNPDKNSQAFEFLCNRLGVHWRKFKEGLNFDQCSILPLCFKCQRMYQEMFQLQLQIKQLETLIGKHAEIIRKKIENAERCKRTEVTMGETQLIVLGLDVFRKKVINPSYRLRGTPNVKVIDNSQKQEASKDVDPLLSATPTTTHELKDIPRTSNILPFVDGEEESDIIKQEVIQLPEELNSEDDFGDSLFKSMDDRVEGDELATELPESSLEDNSIDVDDAEYDGDDVLQKSDSESEKEILCTTKRSRRLLERAAKKKGSDEFIPSEEDEQEEDDDEDSEGRGEDENVSEEDLVHSDDNDDSDFEEINPSYSPRRSKRRQNKQVHSVPSSRYVSKKEYTCHICSAVEIGHKAFVEHYDVHHPEENRYSCKFCKRHFRDLRDCTVHQRKHTGEKPFRCPKCPSAFTGKKSLSSHIFHHHTDRSEVTFPCPECEKEFPSKAKLSNHLTAQHDHAPPKQHSRKKSGKPTKSWACHLCDKIISGIGPFLQHYVELHPEENRYTCKFCSRHFRDLRDCTRHQRKHTGEKPFPCTEKECSKAFRDEKTLRSHQRNIHSNLPLAYACNTCGKQYPSRSALTGHMNVHNECLILCKSCGKSFRNISSFCKHNRTNHEGQAEHTQPISDPSTATPASLGVTEIQSRTKCHVCWMPILGKVFLTKHFKEHHPDHQGGLTTCQCGKVFASYKDCCKHAIRHTEDKSFACDQCPLTFFTSTELRVHSARHAPLEERQNNVCDECGLKLVSPAALVKHKKKHTDNQIRWVCDKCGKSYAEKKGLNHHTKTEHLKILPYKCTFCERGFSLNADLAKHMRSHTGQKPFKCPLCEKCFPYTSSRARHVREVHNVEGERKPLASRKKKTKSLKAGETRNVQINEGRLHELSTFTADVAVGGYQSMGNFSQLESGESEMQMTYHHHDDPHERYLLGDISADYNNHSSVSSSSSAAAMIVDVKPDQEIKSDYDDDGRV